MRTRFRVAAYTALATAGTMVGVLAATAVIAGGMTLPDAPGRAQVIESCMQCHGVDVILARPRSPEEWSQTVSQMIGYGAILTDDQYQTVVTYLSANLDQPEVGTARAFTPQEPAAPAEASVPEGH